MDATKLKKMFSSALHECTATIRRAMVECNKQNGDVEEVFKLSASRMASAYRDCALIWEVVSQTFNEERASLPRWLKEETVNLLNTIENGGVPFCVTANLRRIAEGWGIKTSGKETEQIVNEIRERWTTTFGGHSA